MSSLSNWNATEQAVTPYYIAEDHARHVRQIVLTVAPEGEVPPAVVNLLTSDPILFTNWAATVLYIGAPPEEIKPIVFSKVTEIKDLVKDQPVVCAFAFYRLEKGGVFQIFIQIDTPEIRAKAKSPYIVEFTRNLDDAANCQLIQDLIGRDRLEICFVGPEPGGSCSGYFGLQVELPEALKIALSQEWEDLLHYHRSLPVRNYEAALDQYNRENPLEVSPVLPPERTVHQQSSGQPTKAIPERSTANLTFQVALANALFIGVMAVIAVVAFWLLTREGAIFAFSPEERALEKAFWFPGLEVIVIGLLVAMVWSWMFRIWSFVANYVACFLCLWIFDTFVFGLSLNPVFIGIMSCIVVTLIFGLISYWRAARTEVPAVKADQEHSVHPEGTPANEAKVDSRSSGGESLTNVEPIVEVAPLINPPEPYGSTIERNVVVDPVITASRPPTTTRKTKVGRYIVLALLLLILLVGIIAIQAVENGFDLQSFFGSPPSSAGANRAGAAGIGSVPANCKLWSEIRVSDIGNSICAYGIVNAAYLGGEITYIRFDDDPNAFRLVNVNGEDFSAIVGQCIVVEGVVEVYGQMPYIEIGDQVDRCEK